MDEITLWGEGAGCLKSSLRKGSESRHSVWCHHIFLPGLKCHKESLNLCELDGDELLSLWQQYQSFGLW